MNNDAGHTITPATGKTIAQAGRFARRFSREAVNVTPTAQVGPSADTESVAWPAKCTGPQPGGAEDLSGDFGLYPGIVWLPDGTGGANPWQEVVCWLRPLPDHTYADGEEGMARLVGFRDAADGYDPYPVYAFTGAGACATSVIAGSVQIAMGFISSTSVWIDFGSVYLPTPGEYHFTAHATVAGGVDGPLAAPPASPLQVEMAVFKDGWPIAIPGSQAVCMAIFYPNQQGLGTGTVGFNYYVDGPTTFRLYLRRSPPGGVNWIWTTTVEGKGNFTYHLIPPACGSDGSGSSSGSGSGEGGGGESGGDQEYFDLGTDATGTISDCTGDCDCLDALTWTLSQVNPERWEPDADVDLSLCPIADASYPPATLEWNSTFDYWDAIGMFTNFVSDIEFISQDAGTKTVVLRVTAIFGVGSSVCSGSFVITFQGV